MCHETDTEHRVDLAAPQGVARRPQEVPPVIGLEAGLNEHVVGQHGPAA